MNAAVKDSKQLLRILPSLESLALKTAAPLQSKYPQVQK